MMAWKDEKDVLTEDLSRKLLHSTDRECSEDDWEIRSENKMEDELNNEIR